MEVKHTRIPHIQIIRNKDLKPKSSLSKVVVPKRDVVSISREGKRLLRDIKLAWEAIREAPDIRVEKVELAKERIEKNLYFKSSSEGGFAEGVFAAMGFV
jgi:hypothetical protein